MSGISFESLGASLGKAAENADTAFDAAANKYGVNADPSTQDLNEMQKAVQKWMMANQMIATANKEAGEVFKEFIQKS